jgi:hypothetical protein
MRSEATRFYKGQIEFLSHSLLLERRAKTGSPALALRQEHRLPYAGDEICE